MTKYPLLPYSQLVFDAMRWHPGIYCFPFVLRWREGACQRERIENVLRMVLENHPVFSSQIDRCGKQYAVKPKDILHGQYYDISLECNGTDLYLTVSFSRILGDGKSGRIMVEDIQRAYLGMPLEPDDYWGYIERFEHLKTEPHYHISRSWLLENFSDETVPVRPSIDRCCLWSLLPVKAGLHTEDYTDLCPGIKELAETQHLSMEGFFSLCTALAIAEYCSTDRAALTWAYQGRETPDEQRVIGSLHRDVPFVIKRTDDRLKDKQSLIVEARNQIRAGIAHSDYPYTLTAPYNRRWNYAVNVLRINDMEDWLRDTDLPIEPVSVPGQKYAYALLDVEIHEHSQNLGLWFRYSATHYKQESIRRFAALLHQYAQWLVEE